MNKTPIIVVGLACLAGLLFLWGFQLGKKSVDIPEPVIKHEIKYVKGDPVKDFVFISTPTSIPPIDTADIILQCVNDGVYRELFPKQIEYITKNDTTAIMTDWASTRLYEQPMWDSDTTGTCIANITLQYNRIKSFEYTFTPIQKESTTTIIQQKKKAIEPYVGVGVLLNNTGVANAGCYFKEHYGVGAIYQRDFTNNSNTWGIMASYKF